MLGFLQKDHAFAFVLYPSFKLLGIKELFFYREKGRSLATRLENKNGNCSLQADWKTSSYKESLETDIQHANAMAAAIPKANGGARLQMKLVYTDGRPKRTTHGSGRKASVRDFYDVILPSLQQLHCDLVGLSEDNLACRSFGKKRRETNVGANANLDCERDDECGICLEPCTKMVMPSCCHAMCISCFREWSVRSESCPFCRGSLRRVESRDLWVLTGKDDVIDHYTVSIEDLRRFYLFIRNLPKDTPDTLFLVYYDYLI